MPSERRNTQQTIMLQQVKPSLENRAWLQSIPDPLVVPLSVAVSYSPTVLLPLWSVHIAAMEICYHLHSVYDATVL